MISNRGEKLDRWEKKELIIGITGGIGSGKSTVSQYLREKGFAVVDADEIAGNLTSCDEEGNICKELIKAFGREIFEKNSKKLVLNRAALANKVFNDKEMKNKLDNIMLPKIKKIIQQKIKEYLEKTPNQVVFIDAPLLFESGLNMITSAVWVVDAPKREKIARVITRSGMKKEEVIARMAAQMPCSEKIKMADLILDNSKNIRYLHEQIDRAVEVLQEG